MFVIGPHISIAKGFTKAAQTAVDIGANTFQFFSRNPRGGNAKEYDEIRFNNKIVNHTSFLVDRLVDSACDYIYSDEQALLKNMQEELQDKLFDFIREDEDFKQIVEQLNKA